MFFKYCKNVQSIHPSNLPGVPSSFKTYLDRVLPISSKFTSQRIKIYSASSKNSQSFDDLKIKSFVATCFPPLKVGSFAAKCLGPLTFAGDLFPQYTQVHKSNFECAVCIPFLRWCIINNHPHPSSRSKKASTETILNETAKLDFQGMMQLHEHSTSKCHKEALDFWKKDYDDMEESPRLEPLKKKPTEKPIYDYFTKTKTPLNW